VPARGRGVDGDGDLRAHPLGASIGDRAQRRRKPSVLEHVRMQVEDLPARLRHRLLDRRSRTFERRLAAGLAVVDELLAGERQRRQRFVVQELRRAPALALLGRQRVRG
jgi:hypothetical protein